MMREIIPFAFLTCLYEVEKGVISAPDDLKGLMRGCASTLQHEIDDINLFLRCVGTCSGHQDALHTGCKSTPSRSV